MFQFSAKFKALQREAGLAAQLLGSGATILRSANHAQEGYYHQAFFNLSIGLERAAKLALILDHCIDHAGNFPTDAELRKYGHDIDRLFGEIESIWHRRNFSGHGWGVPDSEIHRGILQTLTEFAKATRYYNLDLLAKGKVSTLTDPIATWFQRVARPILLKHYSPRRIVKDQRIAKAMQELVGDVSMVLHVSETGSPINSIADMLEHGAKTKVVQKWSQFYTLQIIRYVTELISELGYPAERCSDDIPHLIEFFVIFYNEDDYLKSRKTWSPYRL